MDQVTERIAVGDVQQGDDPPLGEASPGREFDYGPIRRLMVLSPNVVEQIIRQRQESGACRWDEVWDGEYLVMPEPDDLHQKIVTFLSVIFGIVLDMGRLGDVLAGTNVTDRDDDWRQNYREPDVAVFLRGASARDGGTHWVGGPDFAVEVVSPRDWTRKKREFYAKVGTRELLYVDRDPWALELYRLEGGELVLVGTSTPEVPEPIASAVLPLSFRLVAGEGRPRIEVVHNDGVQRWTI
jgi:Uma2 family endonuclease